MTLNKFRTKELTWDKADKRIHESIEANSGDSNGRKLVVQVLDGDEIADLTEAQLYLSWKSNTNKHKGLDAFKAVDLSKGIFEIAYTTEMLSNVGNLRASLVLIDKVGRVESKLFTITVSWSNVDDESVQSENSFTALTEALIEVQNIKQDEAERVSAETERITAEEERKTAETARATAEEERKTAETTRNTNETTRVSNETDRVNSEDIRNTNETNRVDAESNRVTAETARVTAEEEREQGYPALDGRITAVEGSVDSLQAFVGYTNDDIMGVEVDFKNKKFTRLAGAVNKTPGDMFDDVQAFGGRKRCILTDDGVVLAYHGEPGYTETGALTQSITLGEGESAVTYNSGTLVQVMVEQPKFYYKVVPLQLDKVVDGKGFHMRKARYYVSDVKKSGFKLHPAFIHDGKEKNFIYLSAYEGCSFDDSAGKYNISDEQNIDFTNDLLSSIAGAKPILGVEQALTRPNTRKLANNRGIGWEQAYAATTAATQLLFTIEYASMNTQTAIGRGNVDKPSGEGNESEITGATTNLGNESGSVENGSISYRGEENFWGNIWKWVDGLNIFNQSDLYVSDHGFTDDIGTDPYEDAGITLSKVAGYISAFGYNEDFDWLFFPSETSGDSALPVGDNFYQTTTLDAWRVAQLGGCWYSGSVAGGFCWSVNNASSRRTRIFGGRLVYVPDAA